MKSTTTKHKVWICFLPLLFLCFSLVFASSPGERKPANDQDAAKFKGRPDNRGLEPGEGNRGSLAALPIPPIPPYEPVPMTARVGFTGLVTYTNTNGVAMINPANHTISPILLNEYVEDVGGPLGTEGGGRFDVAMTSDGRQALISNFGDRKVFFVDLSSGAPVVTAMVQLDFFAEDIAVVPGNQWALVADGGFSPRLAVIHIPTRTWVPAGYDEVTGDPYSWSIVIDEGDPSDPDDDQYGYANGVEIAPDGRTVIVPDYFAGYLHVLLFDPATGSLSYSQSSEQLWKQGTDENAAFPFLYRPVNVAISPDGRTVIGVNVSRSTYPDDPDPDAFFEGCNLPVFTLDAPGHITRRNDVVFPVRISGGQSLVFSPDGRRAYLHTNYWDDEPDPYDENLYWWYSEVQVLAVNGPGLVSHIGSMRSPTVRGTSQLFGVDNLAVTPDGGFLYATNPTISGASPVIDVFDLRAQSHIKQIGTPTNYPDPALPSGIIQWVLPAGIAFPAIPPNRAPQAAITVDKSELILDIPEIATFDGSGSSDPEGSPLTYRWTLVASPAGAAATLAANGATAVLTPDPNLVGTYQVGLVVSDGRLESPMATAFVTTKFYPVLPPSAAAVLRLEDNYIFYKEYVNRLTWSANPGNLSTLEAVKVYRKQKGAGDADYALLASLPAAATGYDDKGLSASQLFTYRITSVNTRGVESDPVVVGN